MSGLKEITNWGNLFLLLCLSLKAIETGLDYVAQASLEAVILLPQPQECWGAHT